MSTGFLPVSREDMRERGIEQLDFVYVTGDAYVDHPSFGTAIISRVLESHGYSVGIIAQPDWRREDSIAVLGRPRLGFLVSAGNMDSCVNHYSVSKKRRSMDAYTPGGETGKRPDHAAAVYGNLIRRTYRDVPVILGGIEASLRRMAHYDYWTDSFKRSVLLDSQADLISYGMGEKSIVEIADALAGGIAVRDITFIRGTVYRTRDLSGVYEPVILPSYEKMKKDSTLYAKSFAIQNENTDFCTGKPLAEEYPGGMYVVQNPPQPPLTTEEMDQVYRLPYMRTWHPSYEEKGGVPAIAEIKFSLISNRGCFGGCSFCALTFHQGRTVQTRSHESILEEARLLTRDPDFKGYLHDVGGPTANFRHPSCEKQLRHPIDYLMADRDDTFFRELVEHHISGQLKVAPEHISDAVLRRMGKPENAVYQRFLEKYKRLNKELGKNQFVVPYLMSSHPGSTLKEAIELAEYLRDLGYMPEQVQDFYPTPSTLSTVMYYTGVDPRDGKPVYVCRNPHEKAMQRALIQYRNPKNYELVCEALTKAGRTDLIGYDKKCLIRPRQGKKEVDGEGRQGKREAGRQNRSTSSRTRPKKTIRNVHKKKS